jgi:hypothetical protein
MVGPISRQREKHQQLIVGPGFPDAAICKGTDAVKHEPLTKLYLATKASPNQKRGGLAFGSHLPMVWTTLNVATSASDILPRPFQFSILAASYLPPSRRLDFGHTASASAGLFRSSTEATHILLRQRMSQVAESATDITKSKLLRNVAVMQRQLSAARSFKPSPV